MRFETFPDCDFLMLLFVDNKSSHALFDRMPSKAAILILSAAEFHLYLIGQLWTLFLFCCFELNSFIYN